MFDWNSINPFGAGFDNVLFLILLAVVISPLTWLAIKLGYAWRERHPRPPLPKIEHKRDRPWSKDGWM